MYIVYKKRSESHENEYERIIKLRAVCEFGVFINISVCVCVCVCYVCVCVCVCVCILVRLFMCANV